MLVIGFLLESEEAAVDHEVDELHWHAVAELLRQKVFFEASYSKRFFVTIIELEIAPRKLAVKKINQQV